jgi:hypothetical protein
MLLIEVLHEIIFDWLKKLLIRDEIATEFIPVYTRNKTLGIFPTPWTQVGAISETMRFSNYTTLSLLYVEESVERNTCCQCETPLGA